MTSEADDDGFFIGWADAPPQADRRFLLRAAAGFTLGAAGLGAGLAAAQAPAGRGGWDQGAVRNWTGIAERRPYPALRTMDVDGRPLRALLATYGKCAVDARLDPFDGRPAQIRGSLIQNGDRLMIAVIDGPDWIAPAELNAGSRARLEKPEPRDLGSFQLDGEILDTKCWFGAMRPARGKGHKACAALCLRGGIPPAFFIGGREGSRSFLLTDQDGGPVREAIWPYAADPVRLRGEVVLSDNLPEFRADIGSLTRR